MHKGNKDAAAVQSWEQSVVKRGEATSGSRSCRTKSFPSAETILQYFSRRYVIIKSCLKVYGEIWAGARKIPSVRYGSWWWWLMTLLRPTGWWNEACEAEKTGCWRGSGGGGAEKTEWMKKRQRERIFKKKVCRCAGRKSGRMAVWFWRLGVLQ